MLILFEGDWLIQSQTTSWVQFLAALLTPLVAFGGLYLAHRSNRLAKSKLQFDLFEKRYAVFSAARDYFAALISKTTFTKEEAREAFQAKTLESQFLFSKEIWQYLRGIEKLDTQIEVAKAGEEASRHTPEYITKFEILNEARNRVEKEWPVLVEKMTPFLHLSND